MLLAQPHQAGRRQPPRLLFPRSAIASPTTWNCPSFALAAFFSAPAISCLSPGAMEGVDLQSVLNKGKQMASDVASSATNGNNTNKKRRKGTDLKPIVTNESATADPATNDRYAALVSDFSANCSCSDFIVVPRHHGPPRHRPKKKSKPPPRKKTQKITARAAITPSKSAKITTTDDISSCANWDGVISRPSGYPATLKRGNTSRSKSSDRPPTTQKPPSMRSSC